MTRRAGAALAAAFALLPATSGAQSPCDPSLRALPGETGYRKRGDRCEGFFARSDAVLAMQPPREPGAQQPLAAAPAPSPTSMSPTPATSGQSGTGTPLHLAGLTQYFAYQGQPSAPLEVRWTAPGSGKVRLRVQGIRRQLYYRMDAEVDAAGGTFEWPTAVLDAARLRADALGATAAVQSMIGGRLQDVYLPLRIGERGQDAKCGPTRLVVWPTTRFDSVTVAERPLSKAGATLSREVGLGYYPPNSPITVLLGDPLAAGLHMVRLVGFSTGEVVPLEFLLYQPPPGSCE